MVGRWRNLMPLLAGCGVIGCGPTTPPAPGTVHGTITYQGRPLAGGLVIFAPDRDRGSVGRPATATTDHYGRYQLSQDSAAAGAITPGWYRVSIADPPGIYLPEYGFPRFPPALRRPDRSGLTREVRPGIDNVFDFPIEVPE